MASQIGIELSTASCRIVEMDVPRAGASVAATKVRRFAVVPAGSTEMVGALAELRGRRASVVVWGAPGDHRQVVVTAGTYVAMRAEASRALAKAGIETRGAMVDIAHAAGTNRDARRWPVVVALANGAAVTTMLRPVVAAGVDVQTVATPATALASLARIRRGPSSTATTAASSTEAYVALEETSTCIAVLRDTTLVAARELSWGFHEGRGALLRRREDIAGRLADELAEFMAAIGGSPRSISQVTLCGGVPELRSLGALLTERLDIEVEPLDSLFGIDEGELPAPEDEFRERCADMRMAWAVAADRPAPLSLLHARRLQAAHARFARAAVASGVMVGVGLGWQAAHSPLLRAAALQPVRAAVRPAVPVASRAVERTKSVALAPPPVSVPVQPAALAAAPAPTSVAVGTALPKRPVPAPAVIHRTPASESAVPFDASLGSILYAPDRRVAVIDGRIVGIGDEIRGARIVEITPNQVLLRDLHGRLRRLVLSTDGR